MNRINSMLSVTGLAVALGAALVPGTAQAATLARVEISNPTNYCQTALPVFDGNVRKRPLSVQNEGASNAFVTCSFHTQGGAIQALQVWFHTSSAAGQTLNCTGVSGYNTGSNEYIAKSTIVDNTGQVQLVWFAGDFAGAPTYIPNSLISISCNLLPGMGIDDSYVYYDEDNGVP